MAPYLACSIQDSHNIRVTARRICVPIGVQSNFHRQCFSSICLCSERATSTFGTLLHVYDSCDEWKEVSGSSSWLCDGNHKERTMGISWRFRKPRLPAERRCRCCWWAQQTRLEWIGSSLCMGPKEGGRGRLGARFSVVKGLRFGETGFEISAFIPRSEYTKNAATISWTHYRQGSS
jgi:hypothetical protein